MTKVRTYQLLQTKVCVSYLHGCPFWSDSHSRSSASAVFHIGDSRSALSAVKVAGLNGVVTGLPADTQVIFSTTRLHRSLFMQKIPVCNIFCSWNTSHSILSANTMVGGSEYGTINWCLADRAHSRLCYTYGSEPCAPGTRPPSAAQQGAVLKFQLYCLQAAAQDSLGLPCTIQ